MFPPGLRSELTHSPLQGPWHGAQTPPLCLQSPGSLLTFTATPTFPTPSARRTRRAWGHHSGRDTSPRILGLPCFPSLVSNALPSAERPSWLGGRLPGHRWDGSEQQTFHPPPLWRPAIQNQGVGRAALPSNPPGEDPSHLSQLLGSCQRHSSCLYAHRHSPWGVRTLPSPHDLTHLHG